MSIEKLKDLRGSLIRASVIDPVIKHSRVEQWADTLSAVIREWEEQKPQAYLTDSGSLLPVCFANEYTAKGSCLIPLYSTPPAVDKLVEAVRSVLAQQPYMATRVMEVCDELCEALAPYEQENKK